MSACDIVHQQYKDEIDEIIDIQKNKKREAIFFMYEQGHTEGPFVGDHTSISLSRDQEKRIQRSGEIVGSVHTHPTGFNPSTIDIVSGLSSGQDRLCVATPVVTTEYDEDFILTCLDFSELGLIKQRQVMQSMRRSSVGITNLGRVLRREFNFRRFSLDQCRIQGKQ